MPHICNPSTHELQASLSYWARAYLKMRETEAEAERWGWGERGERGVGRDGGWVCACMCLRVSLCTKSEHLSSGKSSCKHLSLLSLCWSVVCLELGDA